MAPLKINGEATTQAAPPDCWACCWLQWHVALGAGARCRHPDRWSGDGLPPRIPPRRPTCANWGPMPVGNLPEGRAGDEALT